MRQEGQLSQRVQLEGKAAIVYELKDKIPPLAHTGGCVLGLDHRIPNKTPLEAYRFHIDKAWESLDRESEALS